MNVLLLCIFVLCVVYFVVMIVERCVEEKRKRKDEQVYNLYKVYFRKGEDIYTEIIGASCEENAEEIFYQSVEPESVELIKIEVFCIQDFTESD